MLVLGDLTLHNDRLGSVVLEELLHHPREILSGLASKSLASHGLGELHEVGVGHSSVRVSVLVEEIYERKDTKKGEKRSVRGSRARGKRETRRDETKKNEESKLTLPLKNHTLELVVEDENLDSDVVLGSGLELHGGHGEGSVSVDVDDDLVRSGDLGSDSRGKSETHSSESSRRNCKRRRGRNEGRSAREKRRRDASKRGKTYPKIEATSIGSAGKPTSDAVQLR